MCIYVAEIASITNIAIVKSWGPATLIGPATVVMALLKIGSTNTGRRLTYERVYAVKNTLNNTLSQLEAIYM